MAASSPLTQGRDRKGNMVYTQNYHLLCNNAEFSFHEILEYQVQYTLQDGKISKVETDLIGMSTMVTAESFNAGAVMIYSQFNDENEIIGSMLIFGGSVGQKRIYMLTNPSEENPFEEYYLTSVKQTNFRARVVGEDDRVSLTQVRYNALLMKNRHLFNRWDQRYLLDHSLRVGNNIVPFNFNLIVDYQKRNAQDGNSIYSPHQPLQLLHNQNIMNVSAGSSPELLKILKSMHTSTDAVRMPGALELIM